MFILSSFAGMEYRNGMRGKLSTTKTEDIIWMSLRKIRFSMLSTLSFPE